MAGPCAKRDVLCVILSADHKKYWTGRNLCINEQDVCLRLEGEDYDKCHDICHTIGHAEAVAVRQVPEGEAVGGTAYLFGHYRICDDCAAKLESIGVRSVVIMEPAPEPLIHTTGPKQLILPGVSL